MTSRTGGVRPTPCGVDGWPQHGCIGKLGSVPTVESAAHDECVHMCDCIAWEVIRQSGLTAAKLAELSEGRSPREMTDDESVVFAFSNELARSGRVGTSFRNGCRESLRASMRVGPPYCMSGSPTLRCRCPNA